MLMNGELMATYDREAIASQRRDGKHDLRGDPKLVQSTAQVGDCRSGRLC